MALTELEMLTDYWANYYADKPESFVENEDFDEELAEELARMEAAYPLDYLPNDLEDVTHANT